MVKIRLTRTGKKHAPHYRIIAIQARTKRDGEALEYLGYYNPRTTPSTIEIKKDRVQHWLDNGAQPTDTVKRILEKEGVLKKDKKQKKYAGKPGEKSIERKKKKEAKKEKKKSEAPVKEEKSKEVKAEKPVEKAEEEKK